MIRKIFKWALILILLLFIIVIAGSFFLLATDKGLRIATDQLQGRIPELEMVSVSGNLTSGVQTDKLIWQKDGMKIELDTFDSAWRSKCLLERTYCLDNLHINSVSVTLPPARKEETAPVSEGINLPTLSLPLAVRINEVRVDQVNIHTSPDAEPIVLNDLLLSANATGDHIDINQFTARWKTYTVGLNGNLQLADDYPLAFKVDVNAKEVMPGQDAKVKLHLSDTLRQLAISGTTDGIADTQFSGTVHPLDNKLPLELSVSAPRLQWPLESMEQTETASDAVGEVTEGNSGDTKSAVADTYRLNDTRIDVEGNMDDFNLKVATRLQAATLPDTTLSMGGKVNPSRALIPRLIVKTLNGEIHGSAAADWSNDVLWTTELTAAEIDPGKHWADFDGKLNGQIKADGTVVGERWSLNLEQIDLEGELRRFPFSLTAQAGKSLIDTWQVSNLQLHSGPNSLSLDGTYSDTLDLETSVDFPAIHYLLPEVAGSLKADATIKGTPTAPSVDISARSPLIRLPQALIRNMKLDGAISDAFESPSKLLLTVQSVLASGQQATDIKLDLAGDRNQHVLKASANGPTGTALSVRANGGLDEAFNWAGKLSDASIKVPEHTLTLLSALPLSWQQEKQQLTVGKHCWSERKSRLCLNNPVVAAPQGKANLTLSGYSLTTANNYLPPTARVAGNLNAVVDLVWKDDKNDPIDVVFKTDLQKASVSVRDENDKFHRFAFQSLTLNGQADPYTVNANLDFTSTDLGKGAANITLNPQNPDKSIAGSIALTKFDIGFAKGFVPDLTELAGEISVNGNLGGSMTLPQFNGRVSLDGLKVAGTGLPLAIDSGNVYGDINGDAATLGGSITSGDGHVDVGGNLSWAGGKPRGRIKLKGEALNIVQNPVVYSEIHPDLQIDIQPQGVSIRGDVSIPAADINIRELPEGTTTLSDDVIVIEDIEETQPKTEEAPPLDLNLNVGVSLGDDVNLSGYGLEAKLTGDFDVNKQGEKPPQLNGEITVVSGFYRSYGQDLEVSDGQILFVGPVQQTTLNIDAVREIANEDRIAGMNLTGPIADPVITLFTEPADKSQESILSYIVLGRDLGAGNSADESNMLAAAALALTLRQSNGFATGFAEKLGIEDFAMQAEGSGDDAQVVVSGRLSSKLLLRYGRSVFDGADTLYLRYDISRKLYLEAAQGVERAVDLFYSFSFDSLTD